jgi:hypothetical protein
MTKKSAIEKREKSNFDDVFLDEQVQISKLGFRNFKPDIEPNFPENPETLWTAIIKDAKSRTCSRCHLKNHEKAACWVTTQMNISARRLGPNYHKAYA